jgi:hypothetical protein
MSFFGHASHAPRTTSSKPHKPRPSRFKARAGTVSTSMQFRRRGSPRTPEQIKQDAEAAFDSGLTKDEFKAIQKSIEERTGQALAIECERISKIEERIAQQKAARLAAQQKAG